MPNGPAARECARGLGGAGLAVLLCLLTFAVPARAQRAVTVSGYVSASGVPVARATVSIAELSVGGTSDDEGRYSFIISATQVHGQTVTVVARHRRYETRTTAVSLVGRPIVLDFELEPLVTRAPIVQSAPAATPAGTERVLASTNVRRTDRSDAIDGSLLSSGTSAVSLAQSLSGRIAGVLVTSATTQGGSTRLVVRGPHSLSGDDQPLFVVDGLPIDNSSLAADLQRSGQGGFDYGSSQQDLNTADVASVRVLKGPAAALQFGSRGVNGAVLITTRRGADVNGLAVSASQEVTFDSPLRLPKFQNAYGQGLGGQFAFVDGRGGGLNDSVAQSWGPALDGRPLAQFSQVEAARPDVRFWQSHPDNVRDFFSTGRSLTTNVAVEGSNESTSGRASFGNQDIGGIVPNSYFNRKSGTVVLSRALSDQWHLSLTAQGMDTRGLNRPGTGADVANPMLGLVQLGRQVDLPALARARVDASGKQISWNYAGQNNPYFGAFENANTDNRRRFVGQGSATWDLTSWLRATSRIGTDVYNVSRDFHVSNGWMGGYVDYSGRGDFSKGGFQNQTIHQSVANADLLFQARLNQDRDLRLALTAGANQRRERTRVESLAADELKVPGDYSISNAAKAVLPASAELSTRVVAGYAAIDASYRDRFGVSLTERAERSSLLPASHDRYLNSSVTGSFSLNRIVPGIGGSVVRDGHVHAQWSSASDAPLTLMSPSSPVSAFGGIPRSSVPDALVSSDLHPETTTGWEVGADLQAIGGIDLGVSYYAERRTNQGLVLSLPASSGYTSTVVSGGELSNRGVEARLGVPLLAHAGGISWDISATYMRNSNRVRSLYDQADAIPLSPSFWGLSSEAKLGYPLGVLVGHRYLRDNSTNALLLRDGHPLPDTVAGPEVLGSALPAWAGAIGNTLRYGPVELSVLIDIRWGGKIFSATNLLGSYAGTLAETAFRPDTGLLVQGIDVVTGKPNTTHVSTENYYHSLLPIQERWVYDASFAKLRDARLTFTLPRIPFLMMGSNTRLSVVGRNLFMWTRVPNVDPETLVSVSSLPGLELGQLPGTRSIGLQLSVTP